jgi:hypothetical protein
MQSRTTRRNGSRAVTGEPFAAVASLRSTRRRRQHRPVANDSM